MMKKPNEFEMVVNSSTFYQNTMTVVHNRDQLETYENLLIEHMITGLMAHLEKPT